MSLLLVACGEDDDDDSSTNTFTVQELSLSGTISGLTSDGLILENEDGDTIMVDADQESFEFDKLYSEGNPFEVTVNTQPGDDYCTVANGQGIFEDSNITEVAISCETAVDFTVAIDPEQSDLEITGGQTLTVMADVENQGVQSGVQDIHLAIDGDIVDTHTSLGLAAGDTAQISLQWNPGSDQRGDFEVQVSSDDASDTASANVSTAAFFAVSIDRELSVRSVAPGGDAVFEVNIENQGDLQDTQDITLHIDGEFVSEQELTLEGGDEDTLTLVADTTHLESGGYVATVTSFDDAANSSLTILESAFYAVTINLFESDQNVPMGDTVTVVATITNFGQVEGLQDIELHHDSNVVDTVSDVVVSPGSVESITLEWDSSDSSSEQELTVTSEDSEDSYFVFVEDDCSLFVEIGESCADGSVYAGDINDIPHYTTYENLPDTSWNDGVDRSYSDMAVTGINDAYDGRGNTEALANASTTDGPYLAATACDELNEHGRDDWYLPASGQLDDLFAENLGDLPNTDVIAFWSSSEATGTSANFNAIVLQISNGVYLNTTTKTSSRAVRCVRH